MKRDRAPAPPRLRAEQLRVEVAPAPHPLPLEDLDRWAEQFLEYIVEQEGILPLHKPSAA